MSEQDDEGRMPSPSEWTITLLAGILPALSQHPLVTLLGPLLVPALQTTLALDQQAWQRRSLQGARTVQVAATGCGYELGELSEWAGASDARSELMARVLEASAQTVNLEAKVDALGRVLAMAIQDDARFDEAVLLADALRDLENPHIRVLTVIQGSSQPPVLSANPITGAAGWTHEQLGTAFPGLAHVMVQFVNVLSRHALIRDVAAGTWGGIGKPRWLISEFGEQVLLLLGSEGTEPEPHP